MNEPRQTLTLKDLGIDTYNESVVFMRKDCHVCRSEGFEARTRVRVSLNGRHILATLNTIDSPLLEQGEAALSQYAFALLEGKPGDEISLSHPKPLQSLSYVRSKVYGHELVQHQIDHIINDIVQGYYSGIHLATFLTACAGGRLNEREIRDLTSSMVNIGERLTWSNEIIVDKHSVGGLPGNRTTLIIVPIVAAFGLLMPKSSSRAITSPAGTADTMETLAPVDLKTPAMQKVVEKEGGCIVWGGSVGLSPADDILIRVERTIELDSEGQLIASVLSKKIAAGSTHVLIDMPVGPKAKVRSFEMAEVLTQLFQRVGSTLGIHTDVLMTDGSQPVGCGMGPALEAQDVLAVLQNHPNAPQDLKDRALNLAGKILEFSPDVSPGAGKHKAAEILASGEAWKKFQAICDAQGGLRTPPTAAYTHVITAPYQGRVRTIDNRELARLAKLAGAPHDKAAGVVLHVHLEDFVDRDQPLFTLHAESKGELRYALSVLAERLPLVEIEASE